MDPDERQPVNPSQHQTPNKFRPKAVEALLSDINTKLDQEKVPTPKVRVEVQGKSEFKNHYSPKPRTNWQDHKKTLMHSGEACAKLGGKKDWQDHKKTLMHGGEACARLRGKENKRDLQNIISGFQPCDAFSPEGMKVADFETEFFKPTVNRFSSVERRKWDKEGTPIGERKTMDYNLALRSPVGGNGYETAEAKNFSEIKNLFEKSSKE